jgi:hypothetical protein
VQLKEAALTQNSVLTAETHLHEDKEVLCNVWWRTSEADNMFERILEGPLTRREQ